MGPGLRGGLPKPPRTRAAGLDLALLHLPLRLALLLGFLFFEDGLAVGHRQRHLGWRLRQVLRGLLVILQLLA